jgi:hypothetical protein
MFAKVMILISIFNTKFNVMKRFFKSIVLITAGISVISSCNQSRIIVDDDLYYQRETKLVSGGDANDPTSYSAYKDRSDDAEDSEVYQERSGSTFYENNYYSSNYNNGWNNWNRSYYSNYYNSPLCYGGYNPYYGYNSYSPYYSQNNWGFSNYYNNHFHGNPYGYNPYFGYSYNPYNYYGYNPYNNYNPYGYHNYGYNNGYNYNPYGNPYYSTSPNSGVNSGSSPVASNVLSGPRGGYNSFSGARDAGGSAKLRSSTAPTTQDRLPKVASSATVSKNYGRVNSMPVEQNTISGREAAKVNTTTTVREIKAPTNTRQERIVVEKPTEPVRTRENSTPASRPTESRPTESRPTESRPTESRSRETRPTESKPTESRPREARPTESRPARQEQTQPAPAPSRGRSESAPAPSSAPSRGSGGSAPAGGGRGRG